MVRGVRPYVTYCKWLTAGTYSVTVTDDEGCEATVAVTLVDPSAISASIDAFTNTTCFGAGDGTITVTASGGNPGYNISWDGDTIPGAVAYWPLDESSGNNANDYSGNNHNGIYSLFQAMDLQLIKLVSTEQLTPLMQLKIDRIYVLSSDRINLMSLQLTNRSIQLKF